jgi:hypothetical protein
MVQNTIIPVTSSFIVSTSEGLIEPGRRDISKLWFHALFVGLYYLATRPSRAQALMSTVSSIVGYHAAVVLIVKLFGLKR